MPKFKDSKKEKRFRDNNILGTRIVKLRMKKGWSQQEFAELLSKSMKLSSDEQFSQLTISSYETGRRFPTLFTMMEMATLFDCSLDYLVGLSSRRKEKKIVELFEDAENDEDITSPIPLIDCIIPEKNYRLYDKQPVYVKSRTNVPIFKERWGLLDFSNNKVIFTGNDSIELSNTYELYKIKPVITSILEDKGIVALNMVALLQYEDYIWVELINADDSTSSLYNGYYRHNSNHTCLINTEGLTLPYVGLGKSFIAYKITD